MKITFIRETQGRQTYNERYGIGAQADIRDDFARILIERGDASEGWGKVANAIAPSPEVPQEQADDAPMATPETPGLDLGNMSVLELREAAKIRGVNGYSTMRKAEMIEALREAEIDG